MGPRPGCPVNIGPQEGHYSAWVAWRKGKVGLPGVSFLSPLSLSSRLPRQSSSPPVAQYLEGALAWDPLDTPVRGYCILCKQTLDIEIGYIGTQLSYYFF